MNPEITRVGRVHSSLRRLEDCPRQESENAPPASIEIVPEFAKAIAGVKSGDRLIIFTWLDKSDRTVLVTHPRNDPKSPLTGVFLTRSPDRPNPIGMHQVKVTSALKHNRFEVESLEVLDQTPIIDIKVDLNP